MQITKELKEIRKIAKAEVKLLRKGKVTNQRAREVSRLLNIEVSTIRLETKHI